MGIVNLTPHPVRVLDADGSLLRELPSDGSARAQVHEHEDGHVGGLPVVTALVGAPTGLPAPVAGTWLVVSRTTADAARQHGRDVTDLLVPARLVRDEHGAVVGCRALARVQP